MNVACDYEAPMQMLTTEKYIAGRLRNYNVALRGLLVLLSAQRAYYLPSLSRNPFVYLGQEEQVRVPCSRTKHASYTGFELMTFLSWVRSSTVELCVPLNKIEKKEKCYRAKAKYVSTHTEPACYTQ